MTTIDLCPDCAPAVLALCGPCPTHHHLHPYSGRDNPVPCRTIGCRLRTFSDDAYCDRHHPADRAAPLALDGATGETRQVLSVASSSLRPHPPGTRVTTLLAHAARAVGEAIRHGFPNTSGETTRVRPVVSPVHSPTAPHSIASRRANPVDRPNPSVP